VPRLLVAAAEQVYRLPGVSAVTVIGLALPAWLCVPPPFEELHVIA
jgi:hypothetical protein